MSGEIKDSGSRRVFETGAVRDVQEGKGREDLLPMDIISELYTYKYNHFNESDLTSSIESDVFFFMHKFMNTGNTDFIYKILLEFIDQKYQDSIETAVMELALHFEQGALKYNERNWEIGIPLHCFVDSGLRHALKFFRGDNDEPHDRAFMWNLVCLLWTLKHKPELNDLPFNNNKEKEEDVVDDYTQYIDNNILNN